MPTGRPPRRAIADQDVPRPGRLQLEELAVVDDAPQDVVHVVGLRRFVGHDVVERRVHPVVRIRRRDHRRIGEVVLGQVREQPPDVVHRLGLVPRREMRDAASAGVDACAAERLRVDLLVRDRPHDVGPGDEHVARALDHDREVRHRRRVDRAAGARPEDDGDLRHDAGGQHVAQEDLGIPAQRRHALLDPRPAGVVEPDDRRADLHREVHDLADLLGVRLRQRSAEHREVLREDEDQASVDGAVAGDDAVAEEVLAIQPELRRAVGDECVELDERSGVEEEVEALARGELAPGVLALDPHRSPTLARLLAHPLEARNPFGVLRHVVWLPAVSS